MVNTVGFQVARTVFKRLRNTLLLLPGKKKVDKCAEKE